LPVGSPEYEPEGELLGQDLKREPETVDGKHTAGEVRSSVFMYVQVEFPGFYQYRRRLGMKMRIAVTVGIGIDK
jgi:hypothetical protein